MTPQEMIDAIAKKSAVAYALRLAELKAEGDPSQPQIRELIEELGGEIATLLENLIKAGKEHG